MTEISDRYRRVSGGFASVLEGVGGDGWAGEAPCDGWTAKDVAEHVVGVHQMYLSFVKDVLEAPDVSGLEPAAAFGRLREAVLGGLEDEQVAGHVFEGFFGPQRFDEAADGILMADVLVHTWDLGKATGQSPSLDEEVATRALERLQAMGDAVRSPGVFGPEVPAPEGADVQTRLLCFTGRHA
jgi:uncharacterized protein (TIGR03086 family)